MSSQINDPGNQGDFVPQVTPKQYLPKRTKLSAWQYRWRKLPSDIRHYLASSSWSIGINVMLLLVLSFIFLAVPQEDVIDVTVTFNVAPPAPQPVAIAPLVDLESEEPKLQEPEPVEEVEELEVEEPEPETEEAEAEEPEPNSEEITEPVQPLGEPAEPSSSPEPTTLRELTSKQQRITEINRRVSAAGGELDGLVRISLAFTGKDDIDLHVKLSGRHSQRDYRREVNEFLWYRRPRSFWGFLDVDANANSIADFPVENIVFPRPPSRGKYEIYIHHYRNRGLSKSTPYMVLVKKRNSQKVYRGTIKPRERIRICSFNFSHREDWEVDTRTTLFGPRSRR